MPHGGGGTVDQCALSQTEKTVSLSGVQPQFPVHSRPGKVGEEERFSDIKR